MLRQKKSNTLCPSRLVGIQPITRIYTANQLDGILNAIGQQLAAKVGGAGFYNPAIEAPPGSTNAAPSIPGDAYTVSITQSTTLDADRPAYRATDGSTSNQAHTGSGINGWWRVDFGGRKLSMSYFTLRMRDGSAVENAMIFWVQGSNDASNWTNVISNGINTTTAGAAWYSVASSSSTQYRYFRVTNTAGNYLISAEIEFWGTLT